jgi:hypothetical protein
MARVARSSIGAVALLLPALLFAGVGTVAAAPRGAEVVAVVGDGLCFVTTRDGQFLNLHRSNVISSTSRQSGNTVHVSCSSNVAYELARGTCTIVVPGGLLRGTPHTRPNRAGGTTLTCIGRLR